MDFSKTFLKRKHVGSEQNECKTVVKQANKQKNLWFILDFGSYQVQSVQKSYVRPSLFILLVIRLNDSTLKILKEMDTGFEIFMCTPTF